MEGGSGMVQKVLGCILGCINMVAACVAIQTANAACIWIVHQPDEPEELAAFMKAQKRHQ